MTMRGSVKFFSPKRGYGFIKPDDGSDDLFFHRVDLVDRETLEAGQVVAFEVVQTGKGPKAVMVVPA